MIKECKVLSHNPYLNSILVDFEGMKIQFTGKIEEGTKTIYVKYENGIATIVSNDEYEKFLKPKAVKKTKKVETIDEIVESDAVKNEADEKSE